MVPEDSATFLIRFAAPSPEQLYDATYHVRVLPKHIWGTVPPAVVGGRHHRSAARRQRPLQAGSLAAGPVPRALGGRQWGGGWRRSVGPIWRFAPDPDAALNLVLSHEADLLEAALGPERTQRAAGDSMLRLISYPSAAYGFLGFNLFDRQRRRPHPLLGDRATRRALAMGVDRSVLARSVFGDEAKAPPGPMSQLLWIWSDDIRTIPYDTARRASGAGGGGVAAARWRAGSAQRGASGWRSTSWCRAPVDRGGSWRCSCRRRGAGWAREVSLTAVDFPVFQERLGRGNVRQLHRGVAGRADTAGAGGPVGTVGVGGDQLRPLRESGRSTRC